MSSLDSLKSLATLKVDDKTYHYFSLALAAKTLGDLSQLPMSLKVLLENLLRWEDGKTVTEPDLKALAAWLKERRSDREIQYRPARVLMQDFTDVYGVGRSRGDVLRTQAGAQQQHLEVVVAHRRGPHVCHQPLQAHALLRQHPGDVAHNAGTVVAHQFQGKGFQVLRT